MMLTAILAASLLGQPHANGSGFLQATASTPATSQEQSANPPSSTSQTQENQSNDGAKSSTPKAAPVPEKTQPGPTVQSDCKKTQASGCKKHKHGRNHKTVAPPEAVVPAEPAGDSAPTPKVVRNGGVTETVVELSPGMSPQQISDQRASTTQLLAKSTEDLKQISARQLNESQQDTVKQIQSYMAQAAQADKDGDVQRAHNLAVKANLLSTELTKP